MFFISWELSKDNIIVRKLLRSNKGLLVFEDLPTIKKGIFVIGL